MSLLEPCARHVFLDAWHHPHMQVFCLFSECFIRINAKLSPGIRCTVQLDPTVYKSPGQLKGTVVSPGAPREDDGTYWGYTTRLATSLNAAIDESPYEGGYDLKVGTSERGDKSIDDRDFRLPNYKHALIVFGGVAGIEECVDADESIMIPGSQSKKLFDMWINICEFQGSRTIRTEEAVLIALAKLSPCLERAGESEKADAIAARAEPPAAASIVAFEDNVSDESEEE